MLKYTRAYATRFSPGSISSKVSKNLYFRATARKPPRGLLFSRDHEGSMKTCKELEELAAVSVIDVCEDVSGETFRAHRCVLLKCFEDGF